MTDRKQRRTRAQMIDEWKAKIAKAEAQQEGTYDSDSETLIGRRLRAAMKKRKTVLHRAGVLIHGRASTEKSPPMNGIVEKIERARQRLKDLIESGGRAEEQVANLPFDIERLAKLIEAEEKGEDVEFPTNLLSLPGEGEQTDTEAEVAAGTSEDAEVS